LRLILHWLAEDDDRDVMLAKVKQLLKEAAQ
jgi:hypothetical protein